MLHFLRAMDLRCHSCSSPFQSSDINSELGIATCRQCGAVLDLRARVAKTATVPVRTKVPLPQKFRVTEEPGFLRIDWRWLTPQTFFMLFFCIAWDSFLVFWYGIAFTTKVVPWLMIIFPIGHVAVGVGLTYLTLANLVNRSVVEVGFDKLRVKHGPIPWRGNVELSADEVMQVFCDEKRTQTKSGFTVTYQVNAVLRGNRTVRIVGGLEDRQQALYLEQVIERRLRISDAPVPGELPRDGADGAAA